MLFLSKKTKGFSLVETIIVLALVVIVLYVLVSMFLGYSKTYSYIEAGFEVSGSAATAVEDISSAVRQSSGVLSSRTFSGTNYTTNSTTLVLEVPTVNSSGSIVSSTYDYILFYRSGTDLYRVIDANGSSARTSGTKKLSNVVQSITFTYDAVTVTDATKVSIDLETAKAVKEQSYNQRVRNQVYLRNI